jgi:PAS domain-containing protein
VILGSGRVTGYSEKEMIGQSILKLVPNHLHSEEQAILGRLRGGERIEHYETRRLKKDGHEIEVSLTLQFTPPSVTQARCEPTETGALVDRNRVGRQFCFIERTESVTKGRNRVSAQACQWSKCTRMTTRTNRVY